MTGYGVGPVRPLRRTTPTLDWLERLPTPGRGQLALDGPVEAAHAAQASPVGRGAYPGAAEGSAGATGPILRFRVVGLPATQGSKIPGVTKSGRRYVRESSRSLPGWRQLVADAAQRHAPPQPFEGAIRLDLTFYLPVPKTAPKRRRLYHLKKPDRLKLARAVEDSMTGIFWRDDSQVVSGDTTKQYAYDCPIGVEVMVTCLTVS